MKKIILIGFLFPALAFAVNLSKPLQFTGVAQCGVVPQDKDTACSMEQMQAADYCKESFAHLPTAKEITQFAVAHGAKGIVDNCANDPKCRHLKVTNLDKTVDEFNYSYAGYKQPQGNLGQWHYWLASSKQYNANDVVGLFFDSKDGEIGGSESYNQFLCVDDAANN